MAKKISLKKKALEDLTLKLSSALPELKKILGEKKFERRIKKAARLLNDGVKIKPTPTPKPKNKKTDAVPIINASPEIPQQ